MGLLSLLATMALVGGGSDTPSSSQSAAGHVDLRLPSATAEMRRARSTNDTERKWLKYGLVGGGVCSVVGGVVGYLADTKICGDDFDRGPLCETNRHAVEGALIGAGVGAVVGVLIGLREDHLSAP